jgi:hypothetical protein
MSCTPWAGRRLATELLRLATQSAYWTVPVEKPIVTAQAWAIRAVCSALNLGEAPSAAQAAKDSADSASPTIQPMQKRRAERALPWGGGMMRGISRGLLHAGQPSPGEQFSPSSIRKVLEVMVTIKAVNDSK